MKFDLVLQGDRINQEEVAREIKKRSIHQGHEAFTKVFMKTGKNIFGFKGSKKVYSGYACLSVKEEDGIVRNVNEGGTPLPYSDVALIGFMFAEIKI
ncbi:MAG TPA: hypothetical protein PLB52_00605 [Candidatus Moranbacteria bacterium]|nr:hypothetical protein [Candidatus Moranbacteria bacterium]